MLLRKMLQRKWLLATLLVVAGTAVCIRLGIWQLDRLEQRRAFNAQFEAARTQAPLDLNREQPQGIEELEWRQVNVTGQYDFDNQLAVRNQYYREQYGYHLLTPLRFGEETILVDRGWIPAEGNAAPAEWRKYDEPGMLSVSGQLRLGRGKPAIGGVADRLPEDGSSLMVWNNADLALIASQMPYPILPVYIQPDPDPNDAEPPIPFQPAVELTEGSHFGYALQWFTFATILFIGYPFYVRKQEAEAK
jgi:surfeit locus 1 family protein